MQDLAGMSVEHDLTAAIAANVVRFDMEASGLEELQRNRDIGIPNRKVVLGISAQVDDVPPTEHFYFDLAGLQSTSGESPGHFRDDMA